MRAHFVCPCVTVDIIRWLLPWLVCVCMCVHAHACVWLCTWQMTLLDRQYPVCMSASACVCVCVCEGMCPWTPACVCENWHYWMIVCVCVHVCEHLIIFHSDVACGFKTLMCLNVFKSELQSCLLKLHKTFSCVSFLHSTCCWLNWTVFSVYTHTADQWVLLYQLTFEILVVVFVDMVVVGCVCSFLHIFTTWWLSLKHRISAQLLTRVGLWVN